MKTNKGLPGMPFSLVDIADVNPAEWLEQIPMKISLLRDMRPDLGKASLDYLRWAEQFVLITKKAIELNEAEAAAYSAIQALQFAWMAEATIGIVPRIKKAASGQRQREHAVQSAIEERLKSSFEKQKVIKSILKKIPSHIKDRGKSETARQIKLKAAAIKPATDASAAISALSEKQIIRLMEK